MTLTITLELSPDAEAELQESIAQHDAAKVRRLLADALIPTVESLLQHSFAPLSDDEFEALADQLADDVAACIPPGTPPLSDYAVSRESIYDR